MCCLSGDAEQGAGITIDEYPWQDLLRWVGVRAGHPCFCLHIPTGKNVSVLWPRPRPSAKESLSSCCLAHCPQFWCRGEKKPNIFFSWRYGLFSVPELCEVFHKVEVGKSKKKVKVPNLKHQWCEVQSCTGKQPPCVRSPPVPSTGVSFGRYVSKKPKQHSKHAPKLVGNCFEAEAIRDTIRKEARFVFLPRRRQKQQSCVFPVLSLSDNNCN